MDKFPIAVERVLQHEAGYVNHPRDPGGATNYGITERIARRCGYRGDMRNLPRTTAIAIYRTEFWQASRAAELPFPIGFQLFDAVVNHPPQNGVRWLQAAAGVAVDGALGKLTIAAVKAQPQGALVARFNDERLRFYASLSTWPSFGKGWVRRVAGNLAHAAEDLHAAATGRG